MLKSFYTIVNNYDEFIYFDMGYLEFDEKMPRRSGSVKTLPAAQKLLDKAKAGLPIVIRDHKHIPKFVKTLKGMKFKIIRVEYKEVK